MNIVSLITSSIQSILDVRNKFYNDSNEIQLAVLPISKIEFDSIYRNLCIIDLNSLIRILLTFTGSSKPELKINRMDKSQENHAIRPPFENNGTFLVPQAIRHYTNLYHLQAANECDTITSHFDILVPTVPSSLGGPRVGLDTGPNITVPAVELPDGQFIYDSFRIAEWLEDSYPDAPSLFTGDGKPSRDARPEHVVTGKTYTRLIDLGLGASKSEWAVWYDLFFPQLDQQIIGEEHRAYFTSDLRLGPQGYQKLLALDRQELIRRAKMNIQPLVEVLRERPNQYFQGTHPGQVDYIIFGRYAYCRMLDPVLTKEIWDEQGEELSNWICKLSQAYDGHAQKLFNSF
ncbi:unnamed protein product [Rotaria sordida]|uniref:GST N-terminal domain-containing protein n=1 Tax=Rotaria sordida TaxID=392033 RepID=A0A815IKL0_9BILA|nr:unnamed protein product [Rotaria sordida]CAF1367189.1 unnamed protein product [Rotaria sordida]CAF1368359.1 unnamed protein product [Rotaria sordida]